MKFQHKKSLVSFGSRTVRRFLRMGAMILGCVIATAACRAATFSWPTTPAWAATGPTSGNTETVDYGYNAQGSLRVSVLNSGVTMTAGFPATTTSANANVTGGTNTNSLQLAAATTAATTSYQQVTINFMYTGGATGVSFTLWDVDSDGTSFTDQISSISATTTTGSTIYATVTGSTSNNVANSGTATATATGASANPQTSANGNVTLNFGATAVTSVTFRWANIFAGTRGTQFIGVSPVTFTSVSAAFPEVDSSGAALALCGGVMGFGLFRRRSRNAERMLCGAHT